jgi:hypothetical protein
MDVTLSDDIPRPHRRDRPARHPRPGLRAAGHRAPEPAPPTRRTPPGGLSIESRDDEATRQVQRRS